ncbi:aldehyde-activating protein [Lysobacter niastensis]|uniref:Aldehyde-activating protein n=1 Tax=Lysobacter niastensis TaxID=380629 RepID=A0ABS0B458_9GAMM|nr:aldehyde-activating protein [Lysobacter niastensis]MBF6023336.1 aldehyde-activating protein [Lysobacter niastensis]
MSAVVLRGGCRCGALAIEVTLTREPADYVPRACDCSFCQERDAAWLSDPQGVLRLQQRRESASLHLRQGSNQADFVACAHCGTLVMVACEIEGRLYAAVNAHALRDARFAPEQPASPQRLAPEDKRARWRQLWFAEVCIETTAGAA